MSADLLFEVDNADPEPYEVHQTFGGFEIGDRLHIAKRKTWEGPPKIIPMAVKIVG